MTSILQSENSPLNGGPCGIVTQHISQNLWPGGHPTPWDKKISSERHLLVLPNRIVLSYLEDIGFHQIQRRKVKPPKRIILGVAYALCTLSLSLCHGVYILKRNIRGVSTSMALVSDTMGWLVSKPWNQGVSPSSGGSNSYPWWQMIAASEKSDLISCP